VPSGGRSPPSNGNGNDDSEGVNDMPGGEKHTGQQPGTKDGKRKGKGIAQGKGKAIGEGKGKENGEGKGILKQTPGGDVIYRAVVLQLQKEMYEADLGMKG